MSPKNSSLAFDDLKEQTFEECFVPTLNVIVNARHSASLLSTELELAAVEVKGIFTVSF
ncbi:MAG: hypothetical protein HWD61_13015 [Parachlamydiaceae bacterium]|nr:MAG: hypothetical protein HWD61_13015 [Parachlamydiaceae bacterium]